MIYQKIKNIKNKKQHQGRVGNKNTLCTVVMPGWLKSVSRRENKRIMDTVINCLAAAVDKIFKSTHGNLITLACLFVYPPRVLDKQNQLDGIKKVGTRTKKNKKRKNGKGLLFLFS